MEKGKKKSLIEYANLEDRKHEQASRKNSIYKKNQGSPLIRRVIYYYNNNSSTSATTVLTLTA